MKAQHILAFAVISITSVFCDVPDTYSIRHLLGFEEEHSTLKADDLNLLTNLTRGTFYPLISGRDWLINVCHSKHWECKIYNRYFKESLMFPLSETINDTIHLGYMDTFEWHAFEDMFGVQQQPALLFIKNGTYFYNF